MKVEYTLENDIPGLRLVAENEGERLFIAELEVNDLLLMRVGEERANGNRSATLTPLAKSSVSLELPKL